MKTFTIALVATTIITSAFTLIEPVNWKLKEDATVVSFKGGKVNGVFKGLKSTILFDETNPGKSKLTATIDVNTINTGNGMMNKHAKSEEALHAEKFPMITFESSSVTKTGTSYEAIGKLTIKGITKDVKLPFTFENKGSEATFKGTFSIVPKDFNITRGGTPDQIDVELTIPVTKS